MVDYVKVVTDTGAIKPVDTDTFGGTPADDSITNAMLDNMAAWTLKVRNAATTGDPSDVAITSLTEELTPASGMMLLGSLADGSIRRMDASHFLGGGGGAVDSVFGRTGAVVAVSGDYDADEITETASNKIMTAAERTKLSGIETGAQLNEVVSVGGGIGILKAKSGSDFEMRSFSATGTVSVALNGDKIEFTGTGGDITNGVNVGGTSFQAIFKGKSGTSLEFHRLGSAGGVSVYKSGDIVFIDTDALLPRDGSRSMTGDIDLDGNDLIDALDGNFTGDLSAGAFGLGVTPASQQSHLSDPTGTAALETWAASVNTLLETFGLMATS